MQCSTYVGQCSQSCFLSLSADQQGKEWSLSSQLSTHKLSRAMCTCTYKADQCNAQHNAGSAWQQHQCPVSLFPHELLQVKHQFTWIAQEWFHSPRSCTGVPFGCSMCAESIFIGWLSEKRWSWRVVAGQNVAYDQFPNQYQLFYHGKAKNSLWYDPVFQVGPSLKTPTCHHCLLYLQFMRVCIAQTQQAITLKVQRSYKVCCAESPIPDMLLLPGASLASQHVSL